MGRGGSLQETVGLARLRGVVVHLQKGALQSCDSTHACQEHVAYDVHSFLGITELQQILYHAGIVLCSPRPGLLGAVLSRWLCTGPHLWLAQMFPEAALCSGAAARLAGWIGHQQVVSPVSSRPPRRALPGGSAVLVLMQGVVFVGTLEGVDQTLCFWRAF